jgi:3-oxoadipate enol-lactonase
MAQISDEPPMRELDETGFVPLAGGRLYYERSGAGSPLVLVPPAFVDARLWEPIVAPLAAEHTVVRYDVRGHGRSTGREATASDSADLAALLDHLGIHKASFLGNSDGVRIVTEFAARYPERTRGLVLVAGNPHDLDPTIEEQQRFLDTFEQRGGALIRSIRSGRRSETAELILELWSPKAEHADRAVLRKIVLDNLDRFAAELLRETGDAQARTSPVPVAASLVTAGLPILSLAGAHDNPAPNLMMGRFAAQIPSARFVELPDGDHLPSVSAREPYLANVLGFLQRIDARASWPPAEIEPEREIDAVPQAASLVLDPGPFL